jgi:hypothetical protein
MPTRRLSARDHAQTLARLGSHQVIALAIAALLTACAQPMPSASTPARPSQSDESIESLVAQVRADPDKKPLLAHLLMRRTLLIIPDPHSPSLAVLSFQQNERSFIPVFSDRTVFDQEAFGTGFAGKAVTIPGERFAAMLNGDETVILNPGHRPAIEFQAAELKSLAALPK